MKTTVLFLGNGFDLDLHIKSKYIDFYKATWKTSFSDYPREGLKAYIESRKEIDKWFDLESIISDYVSSVCSENKFDEHIADVDHKFFVALCDAIGNYINEEETTANLWYNGPSKEILDLVFKSEGQIYTFNYTRLSRLGTHLGINITEKDYIHLHGDVANPILGIKKIDNIHLPMPYFSWIKSNQEGYNSHNVYDSLKDANEIIFFGLSFGAIDYIYFKKFFKAVIDGEFKDRKHISIITLNSNSRLNILQQFDLMGVDSNELFANCDLDFIYTENSVTNEKYNKLKDRLLTEIDIINNPYRII